MKKFTKYGSIIFLACLAAYLANTHIKNSIRAAKLAEINAEYDRIQEIQYKLAKSFADCTASSLKPQYLQEFIVYEVMPLGIAWQLATEMASKSTLDQLSQDANPAQLLNKHFRKTLIFSVYAEYEKNSGLEYKHLQNLANGIESDFDSSTYKLYPSKFVYESIKATISKDIKASDIEIGSRDFRWPKFNALAVRCKATPYDLDQLTRNQNPPTEHQTEDEIETARISSMEHESLNPLYLKQRQFYWEILILTPEYKAAYTKIKANNLTIINSIMAKHEPKEMEDKKIIKQANDLMFK
jgi:hypothetical protein